MRRGRRGRRWAGLIGQALALVLAVCLASGGMGAYAQHTGPAPSHDPCAEHGRHGPADHSSHSMPMTCANCCASCGAVEPCGVAPSPAAVAARVALRPAALSAPDGLSTPPEPRPPRASV